jgi:ABC-2 type transport system permease protein
MKRLRSELLFLIELWKANLSSAMEYRASFISQVLGMMINNAIFFVFWILFFERFREVGGWKMQDMVLLFSITTTGFGMGFGLFGNASMVAELIAAGRLDYYLTLPRNALLHMLASRSVLSAWGDLIFGVMVFFFSGHRSLPETVLWLIASLCSGTVIICASALFGCLSFWMGNATTLATQASNALLTLALYPRDVFHGGVRVLMLTVLPAAFIGSVPLDVVKTGSWSGAIGLVGVACFFALALWLVFNRGLRRYESGSAINVNL